eukprot:2384452-Prymnesium_polylepis.1
MPLFAFVPSRRPNRWRPPQGLCAYPGATERKSNSHQHDTRGRGDWRARNAKALAGRRPPLCGAVLVRRQRAHLGGPLRLWLQG